MSAAVSKSLRLSVLSFFTMCALSACGGGDDAEPSATPASTEPVALNSIVVDGGAGTIKAGSYALDTTTRAYAFIQNFLGGKLQVVTPSTSDFDVAFRYLPSDPSKYVIAVSKGEDGEESYGCASSAWTTAELSALIGGDASTVKVPVCAGTVLFDSTGRHIQVSGVTLTSENDAAQRISISANFNWTPLMVPPSFIAVEARSTDLAIGADLITSFPPSDADGSTGLDIGRATAATEQVSVSLLHPKDHPEKYIVAADNLVKTTRFGCISSAWSDTERAALQTALNAGLTLQTCPASVTFDTTSRLLTLNNATLPPLNESEDPIAQPSTLVLSLSRVWHTPSFSGSGSSSAGSSPNTPPPATASAL